jgi:uncharacterized protein YdaL
MDKDVAVTILAIAKSTDEIIVKLYSEIDKIADNKLKFQLDRAAGHLMATVARELVYPIEKKYPDLKIDEQMTE